MAGNTMDYDLQITDKSNSMKQRIDDAKALNRELTKAAQSAFKADQPGMQEKEYKQASGIRGTGASARDFAKESQGLGGLVRLYATVAANLFAVGAAFNALKEAMNTTNMVEGLNQLGATSGQSLGTLSKNLVTATGGALSLRDAMEATAKATAAGMTSKQLMQLGDVARKASQTLGLSMTDAVSRLSRGITKLEPELLDELGLFTKLDKATEDYARQMGKSTASLTDFERRQAFANAVLKEGLDKFGAIDIPANPYDKLLASLKDLAQNGLEVVNKLLGPLLNSLSQSPGALAAGIALISATLVKQAIPAITEYREGLVKAANSAKAMADKKVSDSLAAQRKAAESEKALIEARAEQELAAVDKAAKDIESIRSSSFGKQSKGYAIMQKAVQDVSKEELEYLTKVGDRYKKQGKMDIADRYYNAVSAITASKKAEDEYAAAVAKTTKALQEQQNIFTARGRAEIIAKRATDIAASKAIVSQAGSDTSVMGPIAAWQEMRKNVNESTMGPIRKAFTTVSSTVSIATTAVSGFVGAIQGYLALGSAIVGIALLVDSWFTKNAEQAKAFKDAIETSDQAVKTYTETLKYLNKLDSEKIFSAAAVTAYANSLQGMVGGLDTLIDKFKELDTATTGWDRFTDSLAKFFGKDQLTKFATASVKNIATTLAAVDSDVARESGMRAVTAALGATGSTQIEWLEAIKAAGPQAAAKVQEVEKALKKLADQQSIVASRSDEFQKSTKKLGDTYKDFVKSALDQSPLTKLGDDMAASATKMVAALADPIAGINTMKTLLEDTSVIGIFNPDLVQQINRLKPEIDSLNKEHGQTTKELRSARQELIALEDEYQRLNKAYGGLDREQLMAVGADTSGIDALQAAEAKLQEKQNQLLKLAQKDTAERAKIAELMNSPMFKELAVDAFVTGSKLISRALDEAFAKASIELSKGILSTISNVPGTAKIESALNQKEFAQQEYQIKLQESMIRAQYAQVAATMANTVAIELNTAKQLGQNLSGMDRRMGMVSGEEAAQQMSDLTGKFSTLMSGDKTGGTTKNFMEDLNNAMRTFGKDSPEYAARINQMRTAVQQLMGTEAQMAKVSGQRKLDKVKTEQKIIEETKQLELDRLKLSEVDLASKQRALDMLATQNGYLNAQQILEKQSLDNKRVDNELDISNKTITAEKAKFEAAIKALKQVDATLDTKALETAFTQLDTTKRTAAEQEAADKKQLNNINTRIALATYYANQEARRLQLQQTQLDTRNIREETQITLLEAALDLETKQMKLTDQQIADRKSVIEFKKIDQEETSKLAAAEINYLQEVNKLMKDYKSAAEGEAGDERRAQIQQELIALSQKTNAQMDSVRQVSAAKRAAAEEEAKYSVRQKAYGEVFQKTFEGMADAIVEFARTGKLSFKDLINNMIADLARYELRQQFLFAYQMARPGLMNMVASVFGGSPSMMPQAAIGVNRDAGIAPLPPNIGAKGLVYDMSGRIDKFAQGGAFTNSIVNSPTLFKFAQGTGLMGEAGPEAIMPLKRDQSGNLGVRADNTKTEVVVNNYSGEKATAKETKDSRGNRRIEVVVGDMTASEISRAGSASNLSLRNTFGLQPSLIRR